MTSVVRLKYLCDKWGDYGLGVSSEGYKSEGIRLIRTSDITDDGRLIPEEKGVFVDPVIVNGLQLRTGDLVISRSGTVGRSLLFDEQRHGPCTFAAYLVRFRLRPEFDPRFIFYFTKSAPFAQQIQLDSTQATIANFNAQKLGNLQLPSVEPERQHGIADFLDRETARIDSLLAKEQEVWDRIRFRSYSMIHTAVRGADQGAPLAQRAGLEWLGAIKKDWASAQIRFVADLCPGVGFPHEYQGEREGDFPLLKASDLVGGGIADLGIESGVNWVSKAVARSLGGTPAPEGTIVFPRIGAALYGRNRRILRRSALFDNNLVGLKFREGFPEYWARLLLLLDLGGAAQPGPVPSVSGGQLLALKVPFPPSEEQNRVVRELGDDLREMDTLARKIRGQILSIRERKQALITAAVMGAIGEPASLDGNVRTLGGKEPV